MFVKYMFLHITLCFWKPSYTSNRYSKLNCKKSDFKTYQKTCLKIHNNNKHDFKSCDNCEQIFTTARNLKIYRQSHSYTMLYLWK